MNIYIVPTHCSRRRRRLAIVILTITTAREPIRTISVFNTVGIMYIYYIPVPIYLYNIIIIIMTLRRRIICVLCTL